MKKERLQFPFKEADLTKPEQIKAQLQRERLNKPSNFAPTLSNWMVGSPLAQYIAENGGDEVVIGGGKSLGAFVDPYRISGDLDIKTSKPGRVVEMINDYVADEKDIIHNVGEPQTHSGRVQKVEINAFMNGLQSRFDVDIVPEMPETMHRGTMRKLLSVDEEYSVLTPAAEEIITGKLNRLIWMVSRPDVESFPIRDLYDIYKVGTQYNLDRDMIRGMVRSKIMFESDLKFLAEKQYARDNFTELIAPYTDKKWAKFLNQNVVNEKDTLPEIISFTDALAKEIEF